MIVIERIKEHPAFATMSNHVVFTQDTELMRNRGAIDASSQRQIANAKLTISERGQHPLASGISKDRKKPRHITHASIREANACRLNLMRMNTELVTSVVVHLTPCLMCTSIHML